MMGPTDPFHFNCRFPTLPTPSTVSDGVPAVVVEPETSLLVCADVLAGANISHSGTIASSKLTILKEAVCFLRVRQIGEFIGQPPSFVYCTVMLTVAVLLARLGSGVSSVLVAFSVITVP